MSQPNLPANPLEALQPAWAKFKKGRAQALREIRKSYRYRAPAIQQYCRADGSDLDRAARMEWKAALRGVLGPHYRIEWIGGSSEHPACLINGVMMFS